MHLIEILDGATIIPQTIIVSLDVESLYTNIDHQPIFWTFRSLYRMAQELTHRFQQRGYPRRIITKAYQRARHSERETLLTPKPRIVDTTPRIITTYNNQWRDIQNLLRRNWNILTNDVRTAAHVPTKPLLTAKRARNLKDRITKSHFVQPKIDPSMGSLERYQTLRFFTVKTRLQTRYGPSSSSVAHLFVHTFLVSTVLHSHYSL